MKRKWLGVIIGELLICKQRKKKSVMTSLTFDIARLDIPRCLMNTCTFFSGFCVNKNSDRFCKRFKSYCGNSDERNRNYMKERCAWECGCV